MRVVIDDIDLQRVKFASPYQDAYQCLLLVGPSRAYFYNAHSFIFAFQIDDSEHGVIIRKFSALTSACLLTFFFFFGIFTASLGFVHVV